MEIQLPTILEKMRLNRDATFIKAAQKTETSFESGAIYRKQTNRKANDQFSGTIDLTYEQLLALTNFYKTTLNNGVRHFQWAHPITSAAIIVAFIGGFQYTETAPNLYQISASFEIIREV